MASAQVLTNSATSSRKQGHLEAGKKKLEEFRRRKAEGRAKNAGSTVQLQSIDGGSNEKFSQNEENVVDGTNSSTSTGFSGSHTTPVQKEAFSSTDKHVISSNENTQMNKPFEKSSYTGFVNGYHDHWQVRSELSDNEQSKFETTSTATSNQFAAFDSVRTNVNPEESSGSLSLYPAPLDESRNSSAQVSYLDTSNTTTSLQKAEGASAENRLGLPSTLLSSSSTSKDSVPVLGVYNSDSFNNKGLVDTQAGRKTISESISQRLNLGSASWHSSEASLTDSSLPIRRSQEAHLSSSTTYGVTSSRSRPSFLDTLGVSRASSTSHVPLSELQKANSPVSFSDSMVQSADVYFPSLQQPFTNANSVQQFPNSSPSVFVDKNANSFASSNDILMLETSREYQQGGHEILVPKKDDFSALEQHIEDLTQEKFTLQRALDTSRTLADSLAAENSSLTETYNHQAKVVSELKSEIERLQEEVKDQLRAVESLKLEYSNAQLECNAADERAKILASEVIGLEEKALRLRSNELKMEKQSENLSSEIASYKRKVSILEKERQDFQSTINAMQEEKKLLQAKLRKASSNSKFVNATTVSSSRRDMSTSTDDLGDDIDRQTKEEEILASNTMSVRNNTALNDFVTTTSFLTDGISVYLPDVSVGIPSDQLRMIDNISSLMSELAQEKEELMQALTIETSNSSKLKDLNKELSRKLEAQTQRLELLTAQRMANENSLTKPTNTDNIPDTMEYADEGDEVVERVLSWILKFFPGGSSKRRTSKLL
ncbi:hypothetical protein KFK09_002998 [Dendrobium nobile]|uniref:BLISTER n=1 Tax=Dendrobium nobile TaxID=94219 RepID=A0A8T3C593_DENNO|nr:hypothetical protein KFK09_002998 [Dendrobium nobile]